MKHDVIDRPKVPCVKKRKGQLTIFSPIRLRLLLTLVIFPFRRIRDRQIQDRIREITSKMLRRRTETRGNALEEKRQAEIELREVNHLNTKIFDQSILLLFSYAN